MDCKKEAGAPYFFFVCFVIDSRHRFAENSSPPAGLHEGADERISKKKNREHTPTKEKIALLFLAHQDCFFLLAFLSYLSSFVTGVVLCLG